MRLIPNRFKFENVPETERSEAEGQRSSAGRAEAERGEATGERTATNQPVC